MLPHFASEITSFNSTLSLYTSYPHHTPHLNCPRKIQSTGQAATTMSVRSTTPPKRRASNPTTQPNSKASRMSASAPVFNPSKPITTSTEGGSGTAEGDDLDNGESSMAATSSLAAAAIANSRVTKPLPNSRRPGQAANMAPVQASVPKSAEEKENTRRLIVVLSQVRGDKI